MVEYEFKEKYDIDDLLDIMAILRAPGGCPWDAEQTHESIKKSLIEETYEVIEAINKKDRELLLEELGDVLLQVVFHAQLEKEKGSFDFGDVCDGICKKLIVRHPHVFADVNVASSEEVLSNWDDIKRRTKNQKTTSEAIAAVPRELPALMRAQKIQSKASKASVDFSSESECAEYVLAKAKNAAERPNKRNVGELLFAAAALARKQDFDAEEALTDVTDEFSDGFSSLEKSGKLSTAAGKNTEGLYR